MSKNQTSNKVIRSLTFSECLEILKHNIPRSSRFLCIQTKTYKAHQHSRDKEGMEKETRARDERHFKSESGGIKDENSLSC